MRALAVDTNAAIDFLRADRITPPLLRESDQIMLPLPVFGELSAGALGSQNAAENVEAIERLLALWTVLLPDIQTARVYGELRAFEVARTRLTGIKTARVNDLWIAALSIQHRLPLLTNDRDLMSCQGLKRFTGEPPK